MEKYFKRKSSSEQSLTPSPQARDPQASDPQALDDGRRSKKLCPMKKRFLEFDLEMLPSDPGLRPRISDYHPSDRDEIRRYYFLKGPCQPKEINFPPRKFGDASRKFIPDWYTKFGGWLEYSQKEDAAYCLCCYLMRSHVGEHRGSGEAFITEGFTNWKKSDRFQVHVGGLNNAHNQAWRNCQALMKQKQHIEGAMCKQSRQVKVEYRIRLTAILDCIRFLLSQGLAFRGNKESPSSTNKGNFLQLVDFLVNHNETIREVWKNTRGNLKLTSPPIQKDFVRVAASETTKAILDDQGDSLFAIMIDESRDISVKEQMVVVLRYVNKKGQVIERFLGMVHVSDTSASSLKLALESLLAKHKLSLSRIRGQGYDGESNMRGEYNGLKSLILKENCSAFYIHYFAHQLQFALVALAKKHSEIASFFNQVATLSNVVGASAKHRDILRESQIEKVDEALKEGEISSGRGLNQEATIKRAGHTRWSSHLVRYLS
ncbi:zinc finger MYM-type protein 1-like [Trifolium pratense]|uniref:Uncharacterized protein n=1 Tax=Trifolium pratense TaxID=57577 RepID=A0ACB0KNB1_TRIPR|nr:zinc finger MYM-type protein 1-like [Trifolium pratense]CAJ2657333.1 unnamed protein product [Trifolium pratense]